MRLYSFLFQGISFFDFSNANLEIKETNQGVQMACARALTEIYINCIEDEATDISALILVEPLISILDGGADRATQHTAAYCLNELINTFETQQKSELLEYTAPRLINIFVVRNSL